MSTKIRLSRGGTKKRPYYRIVVSDSRSPRDGLFIEKIGTYNPMLPKDHEDRIKLNEERAKYWISVGAQPTDRVHRFLVQLGLKDAKIRPEQTKKHQPKAKAQEKMRLEAEKAKNKSAENEESAPAQ